jgi:hypothetical protein
VLAFVLSASIIHWTRYGIIFYISFWLFKESVEFSNRFLYFFDYPVDMEGLPQEFILDESCGNDSFCLAREGNSEDVIVIHWRTKPALGILQNIDRRFGKCGGQGMLRKKVDSIRVASRIIVVS